MKTKNYCLLALATIAILLIGSTPSNAASAHTWVAAEGNDGNTGTRSSPYADFATALSNTAVGGMVSVVDTGDYGACTVTQSVTIDGGGARASISFSGGEGIYVDVPAGAQVVLKNLDVDGGGVGSDAIYLASTSTSTPAVSLTVDNCCLHGFTQIGVGVGSSGPENVTITNTNITGGQLGVRTFQSSGLVTYDAVSIRNCVISQASSAAIFSRNGTLDVNDSSLVQSFVGVEDDTSAVISVNGCTLSHNGTAVESFTGSKIRLFNDSILDNTVGIANDGGTVLTLHGNVSSGNTTPGAPNANAASF